MTVEQRYHSFLLTLTSGQEIIVSKEEVERLIGISSSSKLQAMTTAFNDNLFIRPSEIVTVEKAHFGDDIL